MRLLIEIPEAFEGHFNNDRFKDSLERFIEDAHALVGNYEIETAEMLIKAFENGTPLPKGHGDLIDRDELIKQFGVEDATKYGNETAEQQTHSYSTMMMYEIADVIDNADAIIEADGGGQNEDTKMHSM